MSRVVIIDDCQQCPYFSNEYYDYLQECVRLERTIEHDKRYNYPIPGDCPLPKTTDTNGPHRS